jgi:hypothetical protein
MQYSVSYAPHLNREKPWILRVWEPALSNDSNGKRTANYLYQAQYRLKSETEVEAKLAEMEIGIKKARSPLTVVKSDRPISIPLGWTVFPPTAEFN